MLNEIIEKLYTIEHIPSHPAIKKKIDTALTMINLKTMEGIDELAELISYDPSLSIELLKIANSNSYGFRKKISSIKHALQILDTDLIHLIINQHPSLPGLAMYDARVNEEFIKLLKHSIEVHEIIRIIVERLLEKNIIEETIVGEMLSAAVIHDIGFYFVLAYFPEYYFNIIHNIKNIEKPMVKPDSNKLPDHSIIGSILCEYWNLPSFIKTSITFHHIPWAADIEERGNTIGTDILYVGDCISDSYYTLYHNENDIYTINENIIMRQNLLKIMESLGLDITLIPDIKNRSDKRIDDIYRKFGFSSPAS